MEMDWNWFFSALAQSTAAIVGLIGAFVFTKIVNNQSAFTAKKEQMKNLLAEAETLADKAASLAFYWYNERMRENALEDLKKRLRQEGVVGDPNDYYEELSFSIYDDKDEVLALIRNTIEEHRLKLEESRQVADPLINFLKNPQPLRQLSLEATWRQIDAIGKEREKIEALWIDVLRHCRSIQALLQEIRSNP